MAKGKKRISGKDVYAFIASTISILGFFLIYLENETAMIIALVFICMALSAIVYIAYKFFVTWVEPQSGNKSTEKRSSFIKYEASADAKKIIYEVYRLIQIKCPILTKYEYEYQWSGSKQPAFSSKLQNFEKINLRKDEREFDKAIFKFKTPVHYNQNALIHVRVDLDDTDLNSSTYVQSTIDEDIDIIHYRIVLKYKKHSENAILEKRQIGSISLNYTKIDEIPFDNETKSYEYHLLNPDVGFMYRIRWNR
ncbi:MAG: hypothetical protein LBQ28_06270 [Prevotellaceae bacterium]|jgi:hypothetical protein|nr:hypothetical protein [Prevotellaceae bacterium]